MLERGRELLLRLRQLADAFEQPESAEAPPLFDRHDPLAKLYRETVALTDTALRMVPLFPDTTSAQLRLCEGLEAILNVVAARLLTLTAGVDRQRQECGRVSRLAELLTALDAGQTLDKQAVPGVGRGNPQRRPGVRPSAFPRRRSVPPRPSSSPATV